MLRLFKQFYPIRKVFFIFGEGFLIFLSVVAVSILFTGHDIVSIPSVLFLKAFLITLICQTCLYYNELYDVKILDDPQELLARLAQALGAAAIILSGIHVMLRDELVDNKVFIICLVLISILAVSWRYLYNIILDHGVFNKNIAVVGHGDLIETILLAVSRKKDSGYNLRYLCPDTEEVTLHPDSNVAVHSLAENYNDLYETIRGLNISMIVADTDNEVCSESLEHELLQCRIHGVKVVDGNSFYEMATGKLDVKRVKQSWLIYSDGFQSSSHHRFVKRIIDYTLSLILSVLVFPLILVTSVLIKLESPGPIFFSQERMGKDRKNYKMYKFRSMRTDAEKQSGPAWSGQNDSRITRVGKYIRNWRIDELPQLLNVIKGDMSFVGPRPEREFFVNQLEKEIPYYGIRTSVKPGITGWAQVNYGYGASIDDAVEKLNYDLYYIKNASVFMDIYIVFRTTKTVILGVESGGGG